MDDTLLVDVTVVGVGVEGCAAAARAAVVEGKMVLSVGRVGERYGGQHATVKGVDLVPLLLNPNGQLAKDLIDLKAAQHLSFVPVDSISVITKSGAIKVPFTKEHVMLDPSISLPDKRRLMSLMTEPKGAGVEERSSALLWLQSLQLSDKLVKMILYGICMIDSEDSVSCMTVNDLFDQLSLFARSLPQPLLYPVYGSSEIAQALTRVAAVHGALQVLDQPSPDQIIYDKKVVTVTSKEVLKCDRQTSLCHYAHTHSSASLFGEPGIRVYVYPPTEGEHSTLFCLQLNETTNCCKSGYILHFWCFGGVGLDMSRFADHQFYDTLQYGKTMCSSKQFVYY